MSLVAPVAVRVIVVPERVIASPPSPIFAIPFAVSVPLAVSVPVEVSALFTVVVPVDAPSETVVAAPPTFRVVALVLKREAVPTKVVVMSAPFTAKSPVIVAELFTVVVPLDAPSETIVAAPPIFKVVALVLKRLPVVAEVVSDPPLAATFPLLSTTKVSFPPT